MMRYTAAILVLAATLGLGACDDFAGDDTGTLTLLLTDAPGDVQQAWVTIDRIYLQAGAQEPGQEPGVNLMTEDVTVDLMTLSNDIELLVEDAEVPTGSYAQLRVVVTGACIVVEGETAGSTEVYATGGYTECGVADGALQAPSLAQTGIKVLLGEGGVRVTGTQKVLLLDFDVSQSFGHATGAASWVMSPVIRGGEIGLTASISANLSLAEGVTLPEGTTLADFAAGLSTEEADQPFTDTDGDGTFTATFDYLVLEAATSYVVTIVPPEVDGVTFTIDPETIEADVTSGAETTLQFTVTGVTGA